MQVQSVDYGLPDGHPILAELQRLRQDVAQARDTVAKIEAVVKPRRRKRSTKPLGWKPEWMPRFLRVLRDSGGNASAAIRAVKGDATRATAYQYKNRCARFGRKWDAILKDCKQ